MTRFAPFLFALSIACDPATAVLLDGDALDDTADADTRTPDPDSDSDVVEPDTEADTEPRRLRWGGERQFTFDNIGEDCVDTLIEDGPDVTDNPDFASMLETCPWCERIFYVTMDKEALCANDFFEGFAVATPVLRGIGTGSDGDARIFYAPFEASPDWNEFEGVSGSWNDFEYDYSGTISGRGFSIDYEVEGSGAVD